ncbi:MAG: phosphatase PAP2 family protein [Deltaproteobacteria bacterium]
MKKAAIITGIVALFYLALFFFFDKAIDIWVYDKWSHTWIFQLGTYISYLAKGEFFRIALAFCFLIIFIFDHKVKSQWTRHLLYICVSVAIAIVIGEGLKYLLGRYRPIMLFKNNLYGMHFFSSKWALNSTPSGHTLRAFSLFTALSLLYKRFAVVFISIAVLIGASRVVVTAHYASDVLFGAFLGTFTAFWTYKYLFVKNI